GRPRPRAGLIGALMAIAATAAAGASPLSAAQGGDAAAVSASYSAMNQLWDVVAPAQYCGADRACLRSAAVGIEAVAKGLVRPLVRALRTAATPCIVSTASGALEMARLARTGARKALKHSRDTSWVSAVIDR